MSGFRGSVRDPAGQTPDTGQPAEIFQWVTSGTDRAGFGGLHAL